MEAPQHENDGDFPWEESLPFSAQPPIVQLPTTQLPTIQNEGQTQRYESEEEPELDKRKSQSGGEWKPLY